MWYLSTGAAMTKALRFSLSHKITPIHMNKRRAGTINTNTFSKPLVSVSVDINGIGVLKLQRPSVNALSLDVFKQMTHTINEAEKNKWKGLIFTSDSPKVFSGGVDLNEFYKSDSKSLWALWNTIHEFALKLLKCTFVSAAAINGHAAGGGFILPLLTDYRTMVDGKFIIGLNDSVIGIVPPLWNILLMSHVMSPRNVEIAATGSIMYSPKDALSMGCIDELASDKEDAIAKCKQYIMSMDSIPPKVRSAIRQSVKNAPLRRLKQNRQQDVEDFIEIITRPETQQLLESFLKLRKGRQIAN